MRTLDAPCDAERAAAQITTNWLGIEWVDRTKRVYLGEQRHPRGAGVRPERDHVAAPYEPGYSAFDTPLGYAYI
jgi:hypothetical protein